MKKILKFLKDFDYNIEPLFIIALLVILALQVAYRFIPNLSIPWTLEIITFLFGASIWFGVSIAIREDSHVGITVLIDKLPKRAQKIAIIVQNILFSVFIIVIGVLGTNTLLHYLRNDVRTPAVQVNYFYMRIPIIFGCILSLYRLIEKIVKIAKDEVAPGGSE